jgi:hypothetical protein
MSDNRKVSSVTVDQLVAAIVAALNANKPNTTTPMTPAPVPPGYVPSPPPAQPESPFDAAGMYKYVTPIQLNSMQPAERARYFAGTPQQLFDLYMADPQQKLFGPWPHKP